MRAFLRDEAASFVEWARGATTWELFALACVVVVPALFVVIGWVSRACGSACE